MIYMKLLYAVDRKSVGIVQSSTNINEVPGLISGTAVSVSKWSVDIETPEGPVSIGDLDYPIEVHHIFNEPTIVSGLKIYRMVGVLELYFNVSPVSIAGSRLDLRVEFDED